MTAKFKMGDECFARVGVKGWIKVKYVRPSEHVSKASIVEICHTRVRGESTLRSVDFEYPTVYDSEIKTAAEFWRDRPDDQPEATTLDQGNIVLDALLDSEGRTSDIDPLAPDEDAEALLAGFYRDGAPYVAPVAVVGEEMDGRFSGLDPVSKDTNPKDALAGYKPRWFSFLPLQVLIGVGKALFEGGWKYGKHNYRQSGVRASVYIDAAVCGHLMPYMEGQDTDENGMHHIDKAIASLMVLRDSQINGNAIDDRPMKAVGYDAHMEAETTHFQQMKVDLRAKFGDPVAPFTELTHGKR